MNNSGPLLVLGAAVGAMAIGGIVISMALQASYSDTVDTSSLSSAIRENSEESLSSAPLAKPSDPEPLITVKYLEGRDKPESISILCVEQSAFLYVWSSSYQKGGPSIERFPEQDASCSNPKRK
jgi:hypothetical protein